MTGLENFIGPSHGYRDCGTKAEAYQKEAGVACGRCGGISGYQKACDLDENRDDKHMWAVSMEVVGNGCNDENGDKIALNTVSIGACTREMRNLQSRSGQRAMKAESM